ncbi:helix-turn-helix domain-containing protein [Cellulosilyticum sp. I15G10I2]|uniref:helix-turn-helix domain-containing protein n=1 Tax=Cellulosilyticum sp. I15G10I2 TaxID=1892843 RepID=UPI00085C76A7|nr:helix-turn-helix domain-containing protein [Cellulosilyticum sp. I15G10I2]
MFDYTPLRVMLARKNLKKGYLNDVVGLHTTVTAKISKNKYISSHALDTICQHFECQLSDICEIKKDPSN